MRTAAAAAHGTSGSMPRSLFGVTVLRSPSNRLSVLVSAVQHVESPVKRVVHLNLMLAK
jgi:hypothetical protein